MFRVVTHQTGKNMGTYRTRAAAGPRKKPEGIKFTSAIGPRKKTEDIKFTSAITERRSGGRNIIGTATKKAGRITSFEPKTYAHEQRFAPKSPRQSSDPSGIFKTLGKTRTKAIVSAGLKKAGITPSIKKYIGKTGTKELERTVKRSISLAYLRKRRKG